MVFVTACRLEEAYGRWVPLSRNGVKNRAKMEPENENKSPSSLDSVQLAEAVPAPARALSRALSRATREEDGCSAWLQPMLCLVAALLLLVVVLLVYLVSLHAQLRRDMLWRWRAGMSGDIAWGGR